MAGIAADQSSLDRARQHHGAFVVMLSQSVEQSRGEAEVALAEILGILGAVYAGEIEHEISLATVAVKLFGRRVEVVFEDLVDFDGIVARLAVPDVV